MEARMEKAKKKGITWGEAAKIVLENSPRPLTHKEILQGILDRNLKEVKLTGASALACINAMLHANSRSQTDLFHKVEGRMGCYKLNENRTELTESSMSDSASPGTSSGSNSGLSDTRELSQFADDQSHNFTLPSDPTAASTSSNFSTLPSANVSTPFGALPPISSMLDSYPTRVATTTSVTSSVACAIADSRLSSLIAPTPDNLPPSSTLPKKRVVKPRFQSEGPATKKPRVTFKFDKEKKGKQEPPTRPPVKTKAELKYMESDSPSSKNFIPPVLKPPMYPTHTVVKTSTAGFFGQKRHKKMSIAAQVKRSKEGQVDLVSPNSILSKMNVRSLINFKTFNLLPTHYQYQLAKLLPGVDQETGSKGDLRPSSGAFSNEFFTSAFQSWRERLSEGEFTPEVSQKIQQEQDKVFNQDPWKTKHFESFWGQTLCGDGRYVSPVERSHQIMEEVHQEWLREQEREKRKEAENVDLSAPNKISKKQREFVQQPEKNLTAKQRAALGRQQKVANTKTATNKASTSQKKAADGKSSSRGNGGKSSSKSGHEGSSEKVTKVTEKTKGKQTSKVSKQGKVNRPTKAVNSEVQKLSTDSGCQVTTVSINKPSQEEYSLLSTYKDGVAEAKKSGEPKNASKLFSDTEAAISEEAPPVEKQNASGTAKKAKVTKAALQKVVVVNTKPLAFQCSCMLKPMTKCRQCAAFCHSDCISPMSICRSCTA